MTLTTASASLQSPAWWHELATLTAEREAGTPAADATALSLLALLAFCALCFAGGVLALRKREQQVTPPDAVHELQPRADRKGPKSAQQSEKADEEQPKRQPWERGADWWKGDS